MDSLKKSRIELDLKYQSEIADLKQQLLYFQNNNFDVKQLAIKYGAEKAADQAQIKQLKQMNENYKAELEKLYELMNQRKQEMENMSQMTTSLRQSYIQATHSLEEQRTSTTVESSTSIWQSKILELEASREEYRKAAERNAMELTRKNKELVDKIQELDGLKTKYEEALANYQQLNSKLFNKLMTEDRR